VLITPTLLPFVFFSLPSPCYSHFHLVFLIPSCPHQLERVMCLYYYFPETRLCTKYHSLNIFSTNIQVVITTSDRSLLNRSKTVSSNSTNSKFSRL
jgi:hypothetical protein